MKNRSTADIIFQAVVGLLFVMFAFLCVYPFYYLLIYSISDPAQARLAFLWPKGFTLATYGELFRGNNITNAILVSISRTVIGTVLTVLCSSFFAFLVSKPNMKFRKVIYRFVIITMYLNAGLIPWYLTMRMYGLKNSFLLYVLPSAVSAYYVILIKTYMESLPASLEESAKLDGAGYLVCFRKIVFPLSKPILATIAIFAAVNQWNSWSDNFFLVSEPKLQTLQLILYKYMQTASSIATKSTTEIEAMGASASTPTAIKMCVTVITTLPIMLVYPFMQKHFAKGIMLGAVKG